MARGCMGAGWRWLGRSRVRSRWVSSWKAPVAETQQYPSLEINEDFAATRRTWRMQRIGWVLLALFLLAGLLGALGSLGPLSEARIASSDGQVLLTYPRFARYVGPTGLTVSVEAAAVTSDEVELRVSSRWLDVFELYGISPQPKEELADGGDTVFTFLATPGRPLDVRFSGRPHHVGPLPAAVQFGQGERLAFSTFVYP